MCGQSLALAGEPNGSRGMVSRHIPIETEHALYMQSVGTSRYRPALKTVWTAHNLTSSLQRDFRTTCERSHHGKHISEPAHGVCSATPHSCMALLPSATASLNLSRILSGRSSFLSLTCTRADTGIRMQTVFSSRDRTPPRLYASRITESVATHYGD